VAPGRSTVYPVEVEGSMTRTWGLAGLAAATLAVSALACGGGDSPTSPSTGGGTTGGGTTGGGTTTTTITIGANGRVSPSEITVTPGTRVTFVNNDSRAHDMSSDPHPEHTDCPEIDQVGFLQPGQSRQTGNLNTARTCGFHDHNQPNDDGLRGRITIR
jgi:plastocyanin